MNKRKIGKIFQYFILSLLALIALYPLFFMFMTSFKDNAEFYGNFWGLPSQLRWSNYKDVAPNVVIWLKNTAIYSGLNMLLVVIVSSCSAFAFARFRVKHKELIYSLFMILLMMPGILLLVPMYVNVSHWGGANKIWGLILPWTAVEIPLATMILRSFFESIPKELFESAVIDGAGEFKIFRSIAAPLAKPAITTVIILDLLFTMNDLLWPLLIISKGNLKPISTGVIAYQGAQGAITWGHVFAIYSLCSLPFLIIFAFLARNFVEAIVSGAIK